MFGEIIKARNEQLDWAKRASSHILNLDECALGIEDEGDLVAFREAIGSEYGPLIVIAAMDCLVSAIVNALLRADGPGSAFPFVEIALMPELVGRVFCEAEFGPELDWSTSFGSGALFDEIEIRFNLCDGRGALFDALVRVLSRNPPATWGLIEFEPLPERSYTLMARLARRYYEADSYG